MDSCGSSAPGTSRNRISAEQSPDTFSPLYRAPFIRAVVGKRMLRGFLLLNAAPCSSYVQTWKSAPLPSHSWHEGTHACLRALVLYLHRPTLTCQKAVYFCSSLSFEFRLYCCLPPPRIRINSLYQLSVVICAERTSVLSLQS